MKLKNSLSILEHKSTSVLPVPLLRKAVGRWALSAATKPMQSIEELIPKDKGDTESVERLSGHNYEQVKAIIPRLLEWLQFRQAKCSCGAEINTNLCTFICSSSGHYVPQMPPNAKPCSIAVKQGNAKAKVKCQIKSHQLFRH